MHDLLADPVFPAALQGGDLRWLDLPDVLAALASQQVEQLPGLAPHQRQPWYQFLVQLAALATEDTGDPLPTRGDLWRQALLGLAPAEAWHLIQADPARPAFMQPPAGSAAWAKYGPFAHTPDGIDVLVTAKDHDVKLARIGAAEPHHWVYALVALQTLQGYSGRGNFGIARMNGGFASRMMLDFVPAMDWGARFCRAVLMLAERKSEILAAYPDYFTANHPLKLLWPLAWDDEAPLALHELHPYAIEICRRVRLVAGGDGRIAALFRPSSTARVEAKAARGALGDPWIPVRKDADELKSETLGERGFHYRKVVELLFDESRTPPPALAATSDDPDPGSMLLHMSVLVRGQGGTEGLHERILPVRHINAVDFADSGWREELHGLACGLVEDAELAGRALKAGLLTMVQGAPDEPKTLDWSDGRVGVWLASLDAAVDGIFFDRLWDLAAAAGEDRDRCRRDYQRFLVERVEGLFAKAAFDLPVPSGRRERALARGELILKAMLRRGFGDRALRGETEVAQ